MKTSIKTVGTLALVLLCVLASGAALAQHRGHGHGYRGGAHIGLYLGVPLFGAAYYPYYAPYYPRPYYYAPAVIAPFAPTVYIEQGVAQAPPAQAQTQTQGDWFYCAAARAYYPQVSECPAGWQRVPAQPPAR